jgi:hypothetical protein
VLVGVGEQSVVQDQDLVHEVTRHPVRLIR